MNTNNTILSQIDSHFQWMHAFRRRNLCQLTVALLEHGSCWITEMGRHLKSSTRIKHRIKRVDRFVGNPRLHAELPRIYKTLAAIVIKSKRPVILIDWTVVSQERWALVASVAREGRSQVVYQQVHPKRAVNVAKVHRRFVESLAEVLPAGCTPTVVTDAGFNGTWFAQVRERGWDFVGRLTPNILFYTRDTKHKVRDVHPLKHGVPEHFGRCKVTTMSMYDASVVSVKAAPKGRHRRRTKHANLTSIIQHRYKLRGVRPWVLATSLHDVPAERIVDLYAKRMQCEETFRDMKNHRLGLGLGSSGSKSIQRLEVLAMLTALASFAAMVLGVIGQQQQAVHMLQANTIKHRRVFSLHRLGLLSLRHGLLSVRKSDWQTAVRIFASTFSSV